MNSQQAINLLKGLEQSLDDYCELNDEGKAAFRMAITALELFGNSEQLPSAQPEITEDDVKEYCRKRCLIVVTSDFYDEMMSRWSSAQPERLTDDDFETIRIHLNAYKEKLFNQLRWKEADEYQRIIDRFMAFASAQPETHEKRTETHACDCISRKAAIDAMESAEWYHQNQNKDMVHGANSAEHQAWYKAEDVYRVLEQLPYAQAEIIRCKDCKWFHDIGCAIQIVDDSDKPSENDYCSFAERRTDERTD